MARDTRSMNDPPKAGLACTVSSKTDTSLALRRSRVVPLRSEVSSSTNVGLLEARRGTIGYPLTMAASRSVGARWACRDRRVWISIAAAVVVLVVVLTLHSARSRPASPEQQIGDQVYAGRDCLTKVSTNEQVVRRWPHASKAEIIVCQSSESDDFANYVMEYAQFKSANALSAILKSAPPDRRYCTIAGTVVTFDDLPNAFGAMCADRAGTLHQGAVG